MHTLKLVCMHSTPLQLWEGSIEFALRADCASHSEDQQRHLQKQLMQMALLVRMTSVCNVLRANEDRGVESIM